LHTFIVEPFVPHAQDTEYYICIQAEREGDVLLFTHEGGVDVGDVDAKATRLMIPVGQPLPTQLEVEEALLMAVAPSKRAALSDFILALYNVFADLHFTYLEINPLVVIQQDDAPPAIYLV
jgi:ATP citrate (pro-S)-lyase